MGVKWIGALIGFFALGGSFWGAIGGFIIGYIVDTTWSPKFSFSTDKRTYFIDNLLILFAFVMKADGRVTKLEVNYVRSFFEKNFGQLEANKRMLELRDILQQNTINLNEKCLNINKILNYAQKLELLHFLFNISFVDGNITKQELNAIHNISSLLRISAWDFGTIQAMYLNSQQRNYNYQNYGGESQQTTQYQSNNAYVILQVDKNASDDEIKKSYRKLVIKYHPDKVASLGEDIQKNAKEKFQQINAAYEIIKKERGLS